MSTAPWYPPHLVHDVALPRRGMLATALLSPDRVYRYALTRRWAAGSWCAWVLLNPSTADACLDDATITRCVGYSTRWGHAGMIVINLFGLRATVPTVLSTHPDPVGPDNDAVIRAALSDPRACGVGVARIGRVIVGWGENGTRRGRDAAVLDMIAAAGHAPMCLARNIGGTPRHPGRMANDLVPFAYAPQPTPMVDPNHQTG